MDTLFKHISASTTDLISRIQAGSSAAKRENMPFDSLGLRRAARLPVLAVIYRQTQRPILLVTDRADHALTLFDEIGLWLPEAPRLLIPEPNPLFYEKSPWGEGTRRDRLAALTTLAAYSIPGGRQAESAPVLVTSARAVMARTPTQTRFFERNPLAALRPIRSTG